MRELPIDELQKALGERFRIERQIAEGAYGTVFEARDATQRSVALKVLRPELVGSNARKSILKELRIIARLQHSNVLPVLESGEAADTLYYSMPLVTGGSLADRLRAEGRLRLDEALRIARDISDALEYAHAHGVLHRDVTPRQILFDGGTTVVKEFWIARALANAVNEGVTEDGILIGTPAYMSPEQLLGETQVDRRTDVYSLAVLIVQMLTNQLPFTGQTPRLIVARHLGGPLARTDLPPGLPDRVAEAVLRALAPDPRDRFASARELVEACAEPSPHQVIASRARLPAARPPRTARRGTAVTRKRVTVVGGAAAGLLLLALLAVLFPQHAPGGSEAPAFPPLFIAVLGGALAVGAGVWYRKLPGEAPRRFHQADASRPVNSIDRLRDALRYQYDVQRELAVGGMAEVYVAHDVRYRGRIVALKVLRSEFALSQHSERFLEEIEITARLAHPAILPLLDSGDAGGRPYYVMPYVQGETLQARIAREGWLAVRDALTITREVARALDYAHRQQVVHRDIKPENILLHEGQATVTDFGIALALDRARDKRRTGGLSIGTPEYMSPEQFWDTPHIDHRSDLYSLGCVLFEMLTGAPPYSGNANALATKHLKAPIPSASALRSHVPQALDAQIRRMLAKDQSDRFESAAALINALAELDQVTPTDLRPPVGA